MDENIHLRQFADPCLPADRAPLAPLRIAACQLNVELTVEERNLLSVSYKNGESV